MADFVTESSGRGVRTYLRSEIYREILNLWSFRLYLCQLAEKKNYIFLRELLRDPFHLKTCGNTLLGYAPIISKAQLVTPSQEKVTLIFRPRKNIVHTRHVTAYCDKWSALRKSQAEWLLEGGGLDTFVRGQVRISTIGISSLFYWNSMMLEASLTPKNII